MEYDVAVIGGGPAGMIAAGRAAQCGVKTILLEKNAKMGRKLLITGNGRCNITNTEMDVRKFLQGFENGKFLLPALKTFNNADTIRFFNELGLETKIEQKRYVFPVSDNAQDVLDVLTKFLKEQRVEVVYGAKINGLTKTDNIIQADIEDITADRYILCTGGLSYPSTGSTGEGMTWAKSIGHNIIEPHPALVHIDASDRWIRELKGLSLQDVDISAFQDGKKKHGLQGDMLFTDNGVTGPAILAMSKDIGKMLQHGAVELQIDLRPELDHPHLNTMLQDEFERQSKKDVVNVLAGIMPSRLAHTLLSMTGMDMSKNAGNISKEERKMIAHNMKHLTLHITTLGGIEKAIVTAGGVDVKEVSSSTLRSKIVENLYFAGEVLDVDGPSGGYNLQAAWSMGYLAGESAAKRVR